MTTSSTYWIHGSKRRGIVEVAIDVMHLLYINPHGMKLSQILTRANLGADLAHRTLRALTTANFIKRNTIEPRAHGFSLKPNTVNYVYTLTPDGSRNFQSLHRSMELLGFVKPPWNGKPHGAAQA